MHGLPNVLLTSVRGLQAEANNIPKVYYSLNNFTCNKNITP